MSEFMGTEDSWLIRCGEVPFSHLYRCHLYRMIHGAMLLRQTVRVNIHILPTFTTGILFHYYLRKGIREIEFGNI